MRARRIAMGAVLAAIIGGCAPMAERGDFPPRAPNRMVGGTAAPSFALEREVRYYVDEQGATWDDIALALRISKQAAHRRFSGNES